MDGIKVSAMPSAEKVTKDDLLMVVQSNKNQKITVSLLSDYLKDQIVATYDNADITTY